MTCPSSALVQLTPSSPGQGIQLLKPEFVLTSGRRRARQSLARCLRIERSLALSTRVVVHTCGRLVVIIAVGRRSLLFLYVRGVRMLMVLVVAWSWSPDRPFATFVVVLAWV